MFSNCEAESADDLHSGALILNTVFDPCNCRKEHWLWVTGI